MKYAIRALAAIAICSVAITAACNNTTPAPQSTVQAAFQAAPVDILQPEIQRRQELIEWAQAMERINAEQAEYDAAQEAAMLARNATGDYGEVYE